MNPSYTEPIFKLLFAYIYNLPSEGEKVYAYLDGSDEVTTLFEELMDKNAITVYETKEKANVLMILLRVFLDNDIDYLINIVNDFEEFYDSDIKITKSSIHLLYDFICDEYYINFYFEKPLENKKKSLKNAPMIFDAKKISDLINDNDFITIYDNEEKRIKYLFK